MDSRGRDRSRPGPLPILPPPPTTFPAWRDEVPETEVGGGRREDGLVVSDMLGDEEDGRRAAERVFAGGGEMRARCRALDWRATPLGPVAQWPASLCAAASAALGSGFPAILLWGPDLAQVYNDGYVPFLGAKHPDALGRPTRETWPEVWHINAPIYERVRGGETVTLADALYPLRRHGPDGPVDDVYITLTYGPVRDETGAVGGVLITMFDTTERVLAGEAQAVAWAATEAARKISEAERARAEGILEAIADAHFRLDASFRIVAVNGAMERSTRLTRDQLLGRDFWSVFPGTVGTPFERAYRRASTEGAEAHFTHDYSDGRLELVADADVYPAPDGGVAVFWRDVTQREQLNAERARLLAEARETQAALEDANAQLEEQQLELELTNQQLQDGAVELEAQAATLDEALAELRASDQRLRDIFEQAPVAVAVMTGPDHVYSLVSPRYAESPGAGRQLLGRPVREAFPELVDQPIFGLLDHVYATGEPYFAAERMVPIDMNGDGAGEEHYFNVGYQPLRDATGQVYAIASVAYDVTPQILARREVDEARGEAEQANRAKSQFLTTMSHELRTPLNAVIGYAQLLQLGVRGTLNAAQEEDVERIRRSGQHLLSLINDVLNFAKLEAGQVEFRTAPVPLAPLLREVVELIAPQLEAKGLRYAIESCDPMPTPLADGEKMRQILLNLLVNAIKFTEVGGHVTLSCDGAADGVARIVVRDSGRGIAADQLARIFDPFVQVDRHLTESSQQGVGLGLAISRDLARAMGGELRAESVEGAGSVFTLELPRA